ncbi:transposase, partial [Mesoaciditoga sp.]
MKKSFHVRSLPPLAGKVLLSFIEMLFFHSKPRIRQLALFFPSNTTAKHTIKHIQRFLSSFNDKIFKVLFRIALSVSGNNDSILIDIDWTQIQKRYLFTAALVVRNRTLPIAFLLRERKRAIDRVKMIDLLKSIIPSHVEVTIVADGEFCSPAFLDYIHRNGYHYIVRMRKNMLFDGKRISSYSISENDYHDFGFGKYSSQHMN